MTKQKDLYAWFDKCELAYHNYLTQKEAGMTIPVLGI